MTMRQTKKPLLILILTFLTLQTIAQKTVHRFEDMVNPFEISLYDKVVVYKFNGEIKNKEPEFAIVDTIGNLAKTAKIPGKELKKKEIRKLDEILGDTATYGGATAACFIPRLGIVYYYKNKIIGQINICLECNYLQSNPEIPLTWYYKTDIGNEIIPAKGFSKIGRKQLNEFCKKLDLGNCLDNYDSIFD